MGISIRDYEAIMKSFYPVKKVRALMVRDSPFYTLIKKDTKCVGDGARIPAIYGSAQGRASNFKDAQSRGRTQSSLATNFLVKRRKDYAIATMDNETLRATEGDDGAFISALKLEHDHAIRNLRHSIHHGMFRDGSGVMGHVKKVTPSAARNATYFDVFVEKDEIKHIELQMELRFYADTPKLYVARPEEHAKVATANGTKTFTVAKVDRVASSFTIMSPMSNDKTIEVGDLVVIAGDEGKKINGLASWIPWEVPTSDDNFFGVNRSLDVNKLAGNRVEIKGKTILDQIYSAEEEATMYGDPDFMFISPRNMKALQTILADKVQFVDFKDAELSYGFRAVLIQGSKNDIKIVSDYYCPDNFGYYLNMESWTLHSLGEVGTIIDTDGQTSTRITDEDAIETRWASYANLGCTDPSSNTVVKFA